MSYILNVEDTTPLFFSSYGSFVHNLLADILCGNTKREDGLIRYLTEFNTAVKGFAPSRKVFSHYLNDGMRYFSSMDGLPSSNIAGVEEKFEINLDGIPITGFIDVITNDDSGLRIWDHKSHILRPFSNRKKPTKSDVELDQYLRQLYIYSAYIKERYGEYPSQLLFNCFRGNCIVEENFNPKKMDDTKDWFKRSIEGISKTDEWTPSIEYFKCRYLCDLHDKCEYFQIGGR